ncbi:hypothetical protein KP509_30G023300 [Ceratopteris richardii]|uniref:Uncharacterized protein n=1 Tax=Ceratopteris richardii TaxID=49495 RepID=A0A8T2R0V4_CERRI|nr:hypothetical protein KP509_30G023300 [Ceratopteris richardii]
MTSTSSWSYTCLFFRKCKLLRIQKRSECSPSTGYRGTGYSNRTCIYGLVRIFIFFPQKLSFNLSRKKKVSSLLRQCKHALATLTCILNKKAGSNLMHENRKDA